MTEFITRDQAVNFLKEHQPMLNFTSDECDDDLLLQWIESLDTLSEYPNEEYVPLIINSYGGGFIPDGIDEVFSFYDPDVVFPHIFQAMRSECTDTREFAIFNLSNLIGRIYGDKLSIAAQYPTFIDQLITLALSSLQDCNIETRAFAIGILEELETNCDYNSANNREYLVRCYLEESDKYLKKSYEKSNLSAINDVIPHKNIKHK